MGNNGQITAREQMGVLKKMGLTSDNVKSLRASATSYDQKRIGANTMDRTPFKKALAGISHNVSSSYLKNKLRNSETAVEHILRDEKKAQQAKIAETKEKEVREKILAFRKRERVEAGAKEWETPLNMNPDKNRRSALDRIYNEGKNKQNLNSNNLPNQAINQQPIRPSSPPNKPLLPPDMALD
jgi:hypothetical protein